MSTTGIDLSCSEINKKLLNSLPRSCAMNLAVIKKTRDLSKHTISEVIAIIKACDMDDKQREINHVNSSSTANLGISSNNAFSTQQTYSAHLVVPHQYLAPSSSSSSSSKTTAIVQTSSIPKEAEENMALMSGFMNCYNALWQEIWPLQS